MTPPCPRARLCPLSVPRPRSSPRQRCPAVSVRARPMSSSTSRGLRSLPTMAERPLSSQVVSCSVPLVLASPLNNAASKKNSIQLRFFHDGLYENNLNVLMTTIAFFNSRILHRHFTSFNSASSNICNTFKHSSFFTVFHDAQPAFAFTSLAPGRKTLYPYSGSGSNPCKPFCLLRCLIVFPFSSHHSFSSQPRDFDDSFVAAILHTFFFTLHWPDFIRICNLLHDFFQAFHLRNPPYLRRAFLIMSFVIQCAFFTPVYHLIQFTIR